MIKLMRAFCLLLLSWTLVGQEITTLIGNGKPGLNDGQVANPYGLVIGPDKALYWCDIDTHVVRRMDLKTRQTSVVAGTGKKGNSGDGGPATQADLNEPYELRFDRKGNLFFADMRSHVIRRVDKKTGIITTVAGTGQPGFGGDGGYATQAMLNQPHSITFDREGRLLICDIQNHRVRRLDLSTGLIETYLGNGEKKNPVEGAKVFNTPLWGPRAIDVASDGRLYIVLREGNALYEINPKSGTYHLLADKGMKGPKGISIGPKRNLFIADTENHWIQRYDLRKNELVRVAGSGERGDGPDGDPMRCKMNRPHGVFVDANGVAYIADSEAHRIRMMRLGKK
jgi:sugar lactone lactonase YvrE